MAVRLRDYQDEMITKTRMALRTHRNVLLQAPTGAGKTVIASSMMERVAEKGNRGYFICHRKELVEQTSLTFEKFGIPHGFIAAGFPVNYYQPIQICSIDTLKNRTDKVPVPQFCIWDECHHLGAAGWLKVHKFYNQSYHVGLSATPRRLDGKGLDMAFDHLVPGPSVSWLIANGYLADYDLYSIPGVNRDAIKTVMGDFNKGEAAAAMEKPTIMGDIVSHWIKLAGGRKTIGFAPSIAFSERIVAMFNAAGIPAAHLDGKTDRSIRRSILRKLATGELKIVFNVGLFAEGFDIAANSGMDVTIGCVIDAAPTQALGSWLQRCGRALRPQDLPAVIIDHAGNATHGLPDEERIWTLEGGGGGNGGGGSANSNKQCKECYHVHKPAPECPKCGYVYEVKERYIEEVEGNLVKVDRAAIRQQMMAEQQSARTDDELRQLEAARGHKAGWSDHIARARQEKNMLRTTLYNLTVAASSLGMPAINRSEIHDMKPKQLKENIAILEAAIRGRSNG